MPSFLEHYPHPGVTAIPIRDMPPSQTALVWLGSDRSAKNDAFIRAATDILEQVNPADPEAISLPPG